MVTEMYRDRAAIFSDQNIVGRFYPDQNIGVACADRRRIWIANDEYINTWVQPSQLALDSVVNMFIQKKTRPHSGDLSRGGWSSS